MSNDTTQNTLSKPPTLKVAVTQAEISTAVPANSGHCMIADAVKA